MKNFFLRFLGPAFAVFFGDPAAYSRFRWLRRRLKKGNVRTFDAGCGSGALTLYAARIGNNAVGLSFDGRNNQVATERAQILGITRAKFITGDLRKLDVLAPSLGVFDQIICFETIEHIKDDRKLLRDLANTLRSGGKLFLTAPYEHYRRLPGDNISDMENGGHVRWGYTHEHIAALLRAAGFEPKELGFVTGIISQLLIRIERLLSRFLPSRIGWAIVFPFRILTVLDPLITPLLRYPYLSIAVVAEKRSQ
jgi:SAM-dependent methyltransferase